MSYGFGAGKFCELVVAGDGKGGCACCAADGEFVVGEAAACEGSGGGAGVG